MSRPRDYAAAIARMRKLERAQQQCRRTIRNGLRLELARAVLQRELHHNARALTHMHIALAFCRNRYRRRVPDVDTCPLGVSHWIGILSKGTGWTSTDAVAALYSQWVRWCNGAGPEPIAVAWQREFLRREREIRQARRDARKAARVLDQVVAAVVEVAANHSASVAVVDGDGKITVHSAGEAQP